MKKVYLPLICLMVILNILIVGVSGCMKNSSPPQQSYAMDDVQQKKLLNGYFIVIKQLNEIGDDKGFQDIYLVYANDTKVKFLLTYSYDSDFVSNKVEVVELHNADGTPQVYQEGDNDNIE